uniref:Proteoglycan 4a n=1 Tax=Seriola dumerili TaxID=41447 RepID=A0A3B4UIH2_SERDU
SLSPSLSVSLSLSLSLCLLQLCVARCGEVFTRGQQCTCDFRCLQYNECCPDFETTCTTAQSCLGRCSEPFRRGQLCECDPQCTHHNTCCPDYQLHCGIFIDVGLCSDSPINGLTALSNGTILIFKGELFWSVDPVSHEAGLPQSITDTLGVSSPIDTVFTRWSCDRNTNTNTNTKTYIIKGDQFWSLDGNMVVEPGYPKPLASEFPGLTGTIRAALVVPATKNRPETVHFFKDGEEDRRTQRQTGRKRDTGTDRQKERHGDRQAERETRGQTGRKRDRQTDRDRSFCINIKVSLKGFPSPITSALTMPNPQKSDRFFHYLFSGPNSANMAPHNVNRAAPANSIKVWLGCP